MGKGEKADSNKPGPQSEVRSLRSEYDYNSKKNFTEMIGQRKADGLRGLEELRGHPGAKNMEASVRSHKSQLSGTSSFRKRVAAA